MTTANQTSMNKAKVMDGRSLAKRVRDAVKAKVEQIRTKAGQHAGLPQQAGSPVIPTLATVLVGDDPASVAYTHMKQKRCTEVGIDPRVIKLPATTSTRQLVEKVRELADDPTVHGILIQHPVPRPIDKRAAFEAIPLQKDVDCVSSAALGRTILGMAAFASCTPAGIMRLLAEYRVELDGAHAVVIGRSPILGRPMASMLINAHATVTLCHSRTRSLPSIVRHADVLIAAVGRPRFVQGGWIKPGAVVIDAGYNPGSVGDVDFDAVIEPASLITPVPGGVGPMTIATLLDQTAEAAAQQLDVEL